jgi:hypothetical protein
VSGVVVILAIANLVKDIIDKKVPTIATNEERHTHISAKVIACVIT